MKSIKDRTGVEAFGNNWVLLITAFGLFASCLIFVLGAAGMISYAEGLPYFIGSLLTMYLPGFIWTSINEKTSDRDTNI